jgi:hypothetical protein
MGPAHAVEAGFFPLDEELALEAGSLTPQLVEWLVRLATWMPFGRAVQLLAAITKVQVGKETARRQTEQAGKLYEEVQDAEASRLMDAREEVAPWQYEPAARQVFSSDGAMVPLVHGVWGEVKMVVLAEQARDKQQHLHLVKLSYYARMAEAEDFADRALVETRRRGLEHAAQVAAVTDGAVWLQGLIETQCPQAVRILDFPHAAQRLTESAAEVRAAGICLPDDWLSGQFHTLKHEGPSQMLATLRAWRDRYPTLEKVSENLAYLEKREAQMQYPRYQEQEWPIGSGMVESAHKQVMQSRLKGAGMHWEPSNVNPMVALRTAVCNDRWDEAWQQRSHAVQHRKYERRRVRTQQRVKVARRYLLTLLGQRQAVAPAPPPLPVQTTPPALSSVSPASTSKRPDRPAAHHPWRRRLLPLKETG